MSQAPEIEVVRVEGHVPYAAMLARQQERQRAIAAGDAPSTLYLLEHAPVITLGRNAHLENLRVSRAFLAERGIDIAESDRGGDITCHGPGQLVAYPLLDLTHWRKSVNWYLRTLEDTLIGLLAFYGIEAGRVEGLTGVWTGGAKIAAIGVGVRRWVTCHGIALNVAPDMDLFGLIVPCGIADKPVTSMAKLLPDPPPMDEIQNRFETEFLTRFEFPATIA